MLNKDILVKKIKDLIKTSPVVKAMFEEFNIPIDKLNDVSIDFAKLNVSAKTKNKKIYINDKFLQDGEVSDDLHYIVHELTHYLQQTCGEVREYENLNDQDYLDKPTEVEAFQYQVQFMIDQYGQDRAEEYVDDLLKFHDLSGDKAKERKLKLLGE